MNQQNNLQVVLGTGPLGRSVMQALVDQGNTIRMVNRSGRMENLPPQVTMLSADLYNSQEVARVTRGASVVYQCAQPLYQDWVEKFPPLQASIITGVAQNGSKLVVGENTYMYGGAIMPLREGLPYNAQTRKGQVRARMSEALMNAHQKGQVRVTIGRGSDFFGPYVLDSSMGERIFLPALKGKTASAVGDLDLPHTFTNIQDFGRALVMLGEREEALGQAWHVPSPETTTQRELITMIFDEIGLPPKMSGMGRLMMSIGGLFIPAARESVEMMYEFDKPFLVDSSKFETAFGIKATPLRQAVSETVAWYRQFSV